MLIPLTITAETALRRAYLARLEKSSSLGKLIARQARAFAKDEDKENKYGKTCNRLPKDIINFQHDPLACAVALGWSGVTIKQIPLKIIEKNGWLYEKICSSGKPMQVVTAVEGEKFNQFWPKVVTS